MSDANSSRDKQFFMAVKAHSDVLQRTEEGQAFLEFLRDICGKYRVIIDKESGQTADMAIGRLQIIQTVESIMRLTPEQVVAAYTEEGG